LGRSFEPLDNGPWARSHARGKTVAYFIQCITDRFAPEQAEATVQVLRACGARVVVPNGQHCCGLPQLDAGDKPTARRLAKQTIAALERVRADYVVTAAASCAIVMLHDYERLLRDEPTWSERAKRLAERMLDLVTFVQRVADPPQLAEDQLAPTLAYHSFCQSTHVLGLSNVAVSVMRRAGLRVADLPEGDVCCGFGGSTSIDHPDVSRWIAHRKLVNARATGVQVLASDNPRLHPTLAWRSARGTGSLRGLSLCRAAGGAAKTLITVPDARVGAPGLRGCRRGLAQSGVAPRFDEGPGRLG
jgi:Fe-S oxidoreductase